MRSLRGFTARGLRSCYRSICVLGPFLFVYVSRADGQVVTGALEGRVFAEAGGPLEGVSISATSSALQGERGITSDASGRFRLLQLPAGIYALRIRRIGYRPVRVTDVVIRLGATTSLADLWLSPQAVELTELVVSGRRPAVDPTSTSAATVLDSSSFLALPTARDYRSLLTLTPHANSSPFTDGINVAGATGFENGYFIDGIHVTDPYLADGSVNVPYNFIREVQVSTGGYEAEYGRSQGAHVNVITNSGGNQLHAQLLGFFTGSQLRATPLWGKAQTPIDKFTQYDVGGSLGGPLRRDRLWFYAAYNPLFERSEAHFTGLATTQYDTRTRHLFAGKLTWRANDKTNLDFTVLGDPSRRNQAGPFPVPFPLGDVLDAKVVSGLWKEGGAAASTQLRHWLGPRILLNSSLSRLGRRTHFLPRAGATDDYVELARYDDHIANTSSVGYGVVNVINTTRTSLDASLTLLRGTHTAKLGASYEDNAIRSHLVNSFISKDLNVDSQTGQADTVYTWVQALLDADAHNRVPVIYLQDSWEASRRLRINAGLRWESQFFTGKPGISRSFRNELAPRLGIIFQPGALGSQKLFASAGRYYEQMSLSSAQTWQGYSLVRVLGYSQNPLTDSSGATELFKSESNGEPADKHLRGQYYDELTAGYERRLGSAYRATVRGILRVLRSAVEDAAPTTDSLLTVGNPGRGVLAFLPRATRRYTALEFAVERSEGGPLTLLASYVLSRNYGNYTGVYSSDAVNGATGNSSAQFDYPDQWHNATGLLPNDHTHVLKASAGYRFRIPLTVGVSSQLASGAPLSEYGTAPFAGYFSFVQPRGTAGRTPTTWNVDVRLAYLVRTRTGVQFHTTLDVFNLGNQRRPVLYDQFHYTTPEGAVNPNYRAVTAYQAPLNARLGLVIDY